jgi:hypothetical protein
MNNEKIIYSICVDDIYQVAYETGMELTEKEITEISKKIGDYIDWHQAIENAISDSVV